MTRIAPHAHRLRQILTLVTVAATAACADDQSITSPAPNATAPRAAMSEANSAEFADAATVTIESAKSATIAPNGNVLLGGTFTCSQGGARFMLVAYLEQAPKKAAYTIAGFGEQRATCSTSPQQFQLVTAPTLGVPQGGKANVLLRGIAVDPVDAPDVLRTIKLVN